MQLHSSPFLASSVLLFRNYENLALFFVYISYTIFHSLCLYYNFGLKNTVMTDRPVLRNLKAQVDEKLGLIKQELASAVEKSDAANREVRKQEQLLLEFQERPEVKRIGIFHTIFSGPDPDAWFLWPDLEEQWAELLEHDYNDPYDPTCNHQHPLLVESCELVGRVRSKHHVHHEDAADGQFEWDEDLDWNWTSERKNVRIDHVTWPSADDCEVDRIYDKRSHFTGDSVEVPVTVPAFLARRNPAFRDDPCPNCSITI